MSRTVIALSGALRRKIGPEAAASVTREFQLNCESRDKCRDLALAGIEIFMPCGEAGVKCAFA
jgi:hypothetical protein